MKTEKIDIRGLKFDNVTLSEATAAVADALEGIGDTPFAVYTPNSEILQLCIEQNEYYEIIGSASMIIPDGIGIIKAARILGTPLKERVPGVELGEEVLKYAAEHGKSVFFLGGKPGVAEKAAERMAERYPSLKVVGTRDGYFKKEGEENDEVLREVRESGAEILYVCLGVPAQEKWIYQNKHLLPNVRVLLALGGSLDVYSGNTERAPMFFRRAGLEWLYRLMKEPKRIGRMMKLPKFLFGTYAYKFRGARKNAK